MSSFGRLFAVDPSLTCSGWALFDVEREKLLGVGKIKSFPPHFPLFERFSRLQRKIEETYEKVGLTQNDVLICEGHTSIVDPSAAIKVETVRSTFEAVARSMSVSVPGRVSPRSVQRELMGLKGRQQSRQKVKVAAVTAAAAIFEDELKAIGFSPGEDNLTRHQDIADALLVGAYAVAKIREALGAGVSVEEHLGEKHFRRRTSRYGWGKGEGNAFGWLESEIEDLTS